MTTIGEPVTHTTSVKESNELFQNLYAACNYMRGLISPTDYRAYLFPMIFYKRISDVYDEEYAAAIDEIQDEEFAEAEFNHRFIIPDGCHWRDIRQISVNVGERFYDSMMKIEDANPQTLRGIFSNFDTASWTNKSKVTDELMTSLIEHFSAISLGNNEYTSDIIGQAYEYLIKKFADQTKRKAGEYYTPREVIALMIRVLDPVPGDTIYDPACGTGGMLLESMRYMNDSRMVLDSLYGQENQVSTASMCRINLFLHGADDFHVAIGDTLKNPAFHEGNRIKKFSVVVANPPFSLKGWGAERWEHDPYGRNIYGNPSDNNADFAWVQHMICSMEDDKGRMGVVLPEGVAFKKEYNHMRTRIIEDNKLWCVIKMGPELFYGTDLSPMIYFFRQNKVENTIKFVDASGIYQKNRSQNYLSMEDIDKIYDLIVDTKDTPELSYTANLEEISGNNYDLSVNRYIKKTIVDNTRPIDEVLMDLGANISQSRMLESEIYKTIKEGYLDE